MKLAYALLIIPTVFGAASLQSLAASQANATREGATPASGVQYQVRTSYTGWAVPESVPLDPQIVQSHGGSLRPGPHNRQINPSHGGPIASMARPDEVPGRQ